MTDINGSTVLITGVASGIGKALAIQLAAEGVNLVLLDLDEDGLSEVKRIAESMGCACASFSADVRDFTKLIEIRNEVESRNLLPDIIINSAGVAIVARVEDISIDEWRWVVETNLFGCVNVIRVFVNEMISKRSGHIVNIASAAGIFTVPFQSPYVASKYGVVGLTEALRWELSRYGIKASVVCPGFINTRIIDTAEIVGFDQSVRRLGRRLATSPDKMASAILKGIKKNEFLITYPRYVSAIHFAKRMSWRLVEIVGKLCAVAFEKRYGMR